MIENIEKIIDIYFDQKHYYKIYINKKNTKKYIIQ
jgi:hypothetical protein